MSETAAKKDVQKLQRVIVDALEDVKAQDIGVFNTEHLSALFERVVIASGTSNRQTKALSASVRDKVRDAGFGKPRIEGEDNGEWIIADCGAVVVHIMQPVIRQYYNLEEIWGDKPVRLKFGAPKPPTKTSKTAKKPLAPPAAGKTLTPKQAIAAASKANRKAAPSSSTPPKPALKVPATKTRPKAATQSAIKVVVGQPSVKKTSAKKTPAKKASAAKNTAASTKRGKPTARALPRSSS